MSFKEIKDTTFHYTFDKDNEFGYDELNISFEPNGKAWLSQPDWGNNKASFGVFTDEDLKNFSTFREVGLWFLKIWGGEKGLSTNGQVVLVVHDSQIYTTFIYKEGEDY